MPLDRGTNEYYGDEDEKDDYEPDVDAINDNIWLRKKEEEEQECDEYVCCKGDCK